MKTTQLLDGILFANMLRAGAVNLRAHAQAINQLNVFPIPDGDTGDNMVLTILGGVDAVSDGTASIAEASRQAANGMLFSARGNSGVILSQLFDGIAECLTGIEAADPQLFGAAMACGVQHAYHAVLDPVEGTILTVARNAAAFAQRRASQTAEDFFTDYIAEAKRTLDKTPELLPVLKKAGVVDSGGAGLVCLMEGMRQAICGEAAFASDMLLSRPSVQDIDLDRFTEDSILEYGYCTELLLRLQRRKTDLDAFDVKEITGFLQEIGDSVAAFQTGSIVKIHVHTMTPDKVLHFCQKYGEFLKIKIENMSLQHNSTALQQPPSSIMPPQDRKPYGVVAVCAGAGVRQLFLDRGADIIIDGGPGKTPSAEDFLTAFRQVNADTLLVFPNSNNLILAARQAAGLYTDSEVRVVESRTIGSGYAALSMLDTTSGDTNRILQALSKAMENVVTAEISRSVRDTEEVRAGQYFGFAGERILAAADSRLEAVCATLNRLDLSRFDICILIYGAAADSQEAAAVETYIAAHWPGKEIYITNGMQALYDYILILE